MSALIAVRFKRWERIWGPGDVAGFPLEEARQLVRRGIATWEGNPPPPDPAEQAATPTSSPESGAPKPEPTEPEVALREDIALPPDFPCRKVLVAAGIETLGAVPREMDALMAIQGIGHGFAKKILEALKEV